MSRIDTSNTNQNVATTSGMKARKRENILTSVQTNTEPWQPQCQTCLQEQSSKFVFEENTLDTNEYVKAINYINAIHGLINETLLSKSDQGRNLNLKANISLPDLPNFLTLLNSINSLRKNGKPSCKMVSRTTSTSSLITICSIPGEQKYEEDSPKEDLPDTNIERERISGRGDQRPQSPSEGVPETSKTETEGWTCQHCSKSNLKREEDKITNAEEEVQNTRYEVDSKTNVSERDHTSIHLKRKKGAPEISLSCEKQKIVGDNRRGGYEPVLSDAELDHYASELLVDGDWEDSSVKSGDTAFTFTVPINKHPIPESSKTPKIRPPSSSEQGRKKPLQKVKDLSPPPSPKQKSYTQIPLKPKNSRAGSPVIKRTNSRSCSPVKSKPSSSSSLVRPGSPMRPPKKHQRNESINNERWGPAYDKQESLKQAKSLSTPNPKILNFQLPSLTSLEKSKISPKPPHGPAGSSTYLAPQNHIAFQQQQQQQKKSDSNTKKTTYRIQQKEDDDFICSRKAYKTHLLKKSSDSVIMSDKEDQRTYVTNDNHEEICEISNNQKAFTFQSKGSHCNLQNIPVKSSRNFLEDKLLQDAQKSNERFVVSIPPSRRRKDVRNKPFRQARRQSGDSDEIVRIRDYTTPYKQMNESDTNSVDSGSSDIKSDKESPSVQDFQVQQKPFILNYANPSRERIKHKM